MVKLYVFFSEPNSFSSYPHTLLSIYIKGRGEVCRPLHPRSSTLTTPHADTLFRRFSFPFHFTNFCSCSFRSDPTTTSKRHRFLARPSRKKHKKKKKKKKQKITHTHVNWERCRAGLAGRSRGRLGPNTPLIYIDRL